MRIRVQVRQMMFGCVEVEVPDDSRIYNPQTTVRMQHNTAKKLVQAAIANGTSEIEWDYREFSDMVNKSWYEVYEFTPVMED